MRRRRGRDMMPASSERAYEEVARLVAGRTGLAFTRGRWQCAEVGIRRAMVRAGLADVARYRELLAADANALDDLIVELTVGETYFFRDPLHFAFVRREVLPDVRRRRGPEHKIRAWSAGCASGEEAYSLAIVFAEEEPGATPHLRATDISRTALAKACAGVYGSWSLRGGGAAAARPYLRQDGDRFVVDERIRRFVVFEHLNLALDVYPSFATGIWGMDLVLCRNVLIYFDAETIGHVARRLFASLAPGGWLVTGPSDPPLGGEAPYETVVTDVGVFYRRATRAAGELPASAPSPAQPCGHAPGGSPAVVSQPPVPAARPTPPAPARARAGRPGDDFARAAKSTHEWLADASASALHVRALANRDVAEAERACAAALARHPLSPELQHLWAVLLLDLDRVEEAARAVRRVLYLDRSLAVAHFILGAILRRRGDRDGARRAYRSARDLAAARPAEEPVPLADGELAGRFAQAADAQLGLLEEP